MWQSRFLHNLSSGKILNIWWFAPDAALPFFTLNSLLLIVVAIALITESVITWLE